MNFADEAATGGAVAYPEIFTALQEQLGLRLESKKASFDMIIVDRAVKTPIEN